MKVKRFSGKNLNGYLNFNIVYNEDLTFVTGINGTGKTTVLNSIVSLLMPRLDYLTLQQYDHISIEIEHDGVTSILSSTRTEDGATLQASHLANEYLNVAALEWDESLSMSRNREVERSFHREQLARHSGNPILHYIESLPTPMFLGLDRRIVSLDETLHHISRPSHYNRSRRRNVFSQSLSQSLPEALGFAFESYRSAQRTKERLDARFRQDLVLDLIDFEPASFPLDLDSPSMDELRRVELAKRNLNRLPDLLGVDEDRVSEKIAPLFSFLERSISQIKKPSKKGESEKEDRIEALMA